MWIKVTEKLPEIGVPVLLMDHLFVVTEFNPIFIGKRIEKQHVEVSVLNDKINEDSDEDYHEHNEKLGWVPGACYEWEEIDSGGDAPGCYTKEQKNSLYKFLLHEIYCWMPLPSFEEIKKEASIEMYGE